MAVWDLENLLTAVIQGMHYRITINAFVPELLSSQTGIKVLFSSVPWRGKGEVLVFLSTGYMVSADFCSKF